MFYSDKNSSLCVSPGFIDVFYTINKGRIKHLELLKLLETSRSSPGNTKYLCARRKETVLVQY